MPESTSSTNQPVNPWLMALGAFVLGVLVASAWFLESRLPRANAPEAATGTSSQESAASPATPTTGIVAVHDQAAGSSVLVDSVEVPAPGVWVAVGELKSGELGNILGAARVSAPANQVLVNLLRPTVPQMTYAVVLYRDNGDGSFDPKSDSVYVDFETGERVVALFTTTL